MMNASLRNALSIVLVPGWLLTSSCNPPRSSSFSGLGFLPGDFRSLATSVSDDGSVVVGVSGNSSSGQAFRWTAASGMVGLGFLPGGSRSYASAVSGDGTVIIGGSKTFSGDRAFIWTEKRGMISLDVCPIRVAILVPTAFPVTVQ